MMSTFYDPDPGAQAPKTLHVLHRTENRVLCCAKLSKLELYGSPRYREVRDFLAAHPDNRDAEYRLCDPCLAEYLPPPKP